MIVLMHDEETNALWSVLACPHCLGDFNRTNNHIECISCHTVFEENGNGQLDLRLRREKRLSVPFVITPFFKPDEDIFHVLPSNPEMKVDNTKLLFDPKEMASYVPPPSSKGSMMLDLGCGNAKYKPAFEEIGFTYVGMDYDSKEAPLLGDAHALPFKSKSFEFLLSRAVLEHLQFPFVAINEAYRVLKPRSRFIGSVAFLEPFHGRSFYHHTHYGLLNCLEHAGFRVNHISPNAKWDVLTAQASMGLFPKLPGCVSRALVFPLRMIHKAYWKIGHLLNPQQVKEITRLLTTAGSFLFVASKE